MFPLNEPSVHEQVQELILNLIFTMKINIFFLISKLYTRLVLIPLLSCFQFFFQISMLKALPKRSLIVGNYVVTVSYLS